MPHRRHARLPLLLALAVCAMLGAAPSAAQAPSAGADPRDFGARCGASADATAAIQAAVDAAEAKSGLVRISCPLRIEGQVRVDGSVQIAGVGPMYYAGMADIPGPSAYPSSGPALECASRTLPCLLIGGMGVGVRHINFWNPQPVPPRTGDWAPFVYPFVIATRSDASWQGLVLDHLTFTTVSRAIDLEGTPDYRRYAGSQIRISDIWCNACLNVGIRVHLIDNPLIISHVEFTPAYYFDHPPLGAYMRSHGIGFDIEYAAGMLVHDVDFFALGQAMRFANGEVDNDLGRIVLAASGEMSDIQFQQVCQAMTTPEGGGANIQLQITNPYFWGDQSGFHCARGKFMIDLPSDSVDLSMSPVGVWEVDGFARVGATSRGGALLRMNDVDVKQYDAFGPDLPFIAATANTEVVLGSTNMAAIRPARGARGALMGPGADGSRASMTPLQVGGGQIGAEGAAELNGSGDQTHTGFVSFYATDHRRAGYVGYAEAGSGPALEADTGPVRLQPDHGASTRQMVVGVDREGKLQINVDGLPTACADEPRGTLWNDAGAVKVCP